MTSNGGGFRGFFNTKFGRVQAIIEEQFHHLVGISWATVAQVAGVRPVTGGFQVGTPAPFIEVIMSVNCAVIVHRQCIPGPLRQLRRSPTACSV